MRSASSSFSRPLALGVLAPLLFEEGADLVAGAAGPHQFQPVARGAALLLRGQHLDDVAGAQLVVQRHDVAVDLGADAAVADVGVDGVGEVERGRAGGEVLHFALRGEDEDLVLEEVDLQRLEELGRVLLALGLDQLAQPGHLLPLRVVAAALFVGDVGGDPVLGELVHLLGADLDLQRLALGPDHRRVQRLVHVGLRHRDEVLEAARAAASRASG